MSDECCYIEIIMALGFIDGLKPQNIYFLEREEYTWFCNLRYSYSGILSEPIWLLIL